MSSMMSHVLDVVLSHDLDQVDSTHKIVGVIQHGMLDAFTHCLAPREMDHGVEPAPVLVVFPLEIASMSI